MPYIVNAEMFLPETKSLASSITLSSNWLWAFVIPFAFIPAEKAVGIEGVFLFFAVVSFLGEIKIRS